jgi:hypothetical protein
MNAQLVSGKPLALQCWTFDVGRWAFFFFNQIPATPQCGHPEPIPQLPEQSKEPVKCSE